MLAEAARWGEAFGDDTVAAMIDRLVHHGDVIALGGDSWGSATGAGESAARAMVGPVMAMRSASPLAPSASMPMGNSRARNHSQYGRRAPG